MENGIHTNKSNKSNKSKTIIVVILIILLIILFMIILGAIGYYLYNKHKNKKLSNTKQFVQITPQISLIPATKSYTPQISQIQNLPQIQDLPQMQDLPQIQDLPVGYREQSSSQQIEYGKILQNDRITSPTCINNLCLTSQNNLYKACINTDGDFVLYSGDNMSTDTKRWSINKKSPSGKLCMNNSGNLGAYTIDGKEYWKSENTTTLNLNPKYTAIMQNNGNFVVYDNNNNVIWMAKNN